MAAAVIEQEIDAAFLALAAEVGWEVEEVIEDAVRDGAEGVAGERGGRSESLREEEFAEEIVAGEALVRSLAAEDDFEVAGGPLSEAVEGDDEGVADGAVHVPDDLREELEIGWLDVDGVVSGAEEAGGFLRVLGFVDGGIEADAVGTDARGDFRHAGGDERGIDSAGEVGADGYIAAHVETDGVVPEAFEFFEVVVIGAVAAVGEGDFPVALDGEAAVAGEFHPVGGGEHFDALEHGGGFGDIAEAEVGVDGAGTAAGRDVTALEDAFGFAREEKPSVLVMVIERFLAAAVAGEEGGPAAFVAQAEGEHAIEPGEQTGEAPLFVAVDEGFGIAGGAERVAEGGQFRLQFPVIVDFAIEDDGDGLVLVEDGLPATGEVDDAEAAHAHGEFRAFVAAVAVRSPVNLYAGHAVEQTFFMEPGVAVDAAHVRERETGSCTVAAGKSTPCGERDGTGRRGVDG